ncbi:MAG: UDP-N-acetylglucosamine--N-acetylmuramyl-(pentapeptide) pyrophosphoryl-undecaprenol N-acetylglucosamine transferase, partial [Caldisericia bacterium]|nr:UDP-N-acetylglucosamine--N-acetylmuramyl-(pentapeptide) pyrophosphoryl-undecaprenol N-acetylglucosamine transferase [Caldisericia bacterium]
MRVLIATGGTGGHIYPGILIGKYLKEKGSEVLFTIGRRERELKILKKENLNFISLFISLKIINKFKPQKIVATGSYSSFPILFWVNLLKIPYFLHEQNVLPGKVNKIFSKNAKKIFISFENTKNYLDTKNYIFSGFPIREKIGKIEKNEGKEKLKINTDKKIFLLLGGSGGSKYLLELVKRFEEDLNSMNLFGLIIKGNISFEEKFKFENKVFDYIDEIEYAYGASDFVIARGGAGTLWEIFVSKKPSIIIPIKGSEHQIKNSEIIENLKIGEVFNSEDESKFIEKVRIV